MYKALAILCASAVIQTISAQCIGAGYGLGPWNAPIAPCEAIAPIVAPCDTIASIGWGVPFGNGFGPAALAASNGAGLVVTSASPIAPTGVSMTSENAYEGPLAVSGAIPFLGAVALEGALPTIGGGAVTYGCGNGNVAMISEDIGFNGIGAYGPYGLGYDGLPGPYGFGPLGYDGLAGPYGFGPLGYDGLAGPYGIAGPYGYPGYGVGCAGVRI